MITEGGSQKAALAESRYGIWDWVIVLEAPPYRHLIRAVQVQQQIAAMDRSQ